uniref:Shikimate 5-dehydrogenase n=1 Tax=uncultured Bacteroidota bacterium TaxID=152509 RepID=H5SIE9_9BACT|nr:shikimate 5-dehydrogenase [uncultured Bacteroidetes bacterium]
MKLGLVAGEKVLSFSPLIFQRMHGLWYEVYTPDETSPLKAQIAAKGWIGFNVTTPYKEKIFPLLDEAAPEVSAIQAVNTVCVLPDGRWQGHNTDYWAARYLLGEFESVYGGWEAMLVLGTGGAARAVAYAWAELYPATPLYFVSRQAAHSKKLPSPSPYTLLSWEDLASYPFPDKLLLVQATPLGMFPEVHTLPPFPLERIQPGWVVWDLIYNPYPTRFLSEVRKRGAPTEGGMRFLGLQAERSRELWNELWLKAYKKKRGVVAS